MVTVSTLATLSISPVPTLCRFQSTLLYENYVCMCTPLLSDKYKILPKNCFIGCCNVYWFPSVSKLYIKSILLIYYYHNPHLYLSKKTQTCLIKYWQTSDCFIFYHDTHHGRKSLYCKVIWVNVEFNRLHLRKFLFGCEYQDRQRSV